MIKRVHFTGFRSLKDADLRLGPLTALVGPNATGKSTVLAGLKAGFVRADIADFWRRDVGQSLLRIVSMDDGRVMKQGQEQTSRSRLQAEKIYTDQALRLDVAALRRTAQVQPATMLSETGDNLANVLATLPRRVQEVIAREFCRLVPVFADVDVRPIANAAGHHNIVFQDRWREEVWYEPDAVSDGSMLMLAFAALPHQSSAPDLLTIEEPEHGLHPYLLQQLVELLRGIATGTVGPRPIQVVLATHSAELLEHLRPEEVRFLSRQGDGSVLIEEAPVDDPDWKNVYDEYQHSLGGLWLSGNLGGVPGSAA